MTGTRVNLYIIRLSGLSNHVWLAGHGTTVGVLVAAVDAASVDSHGFVVGWVPVVDAGAIGHLPVPATGVVAVVVELYDLNMSGLYR